jgi:hypothetical protein
MQMNAAVDTVLKYSNNAAVDTSLKMQSNKVTENDVSWSQGSRPLNQQGKDRDVDLSSVQLIMPILITRIVLIPSHQSQWNGSTSSNTNITVIKRQGTQTCKITTSACCPSSWSVNSKRVDRRARRFEFC